MIDCALGIGAKKIVLPDIEKSDREFFSVGPPKIMYQTLGPCTPPGDKYRSSKKQIRQTFTFLDLSRPKTQSTDQSRFKDLFKSWT